MAYCYIRFAGAPYRHSCKRYVEKKEEEWKQKKKKKKCRQNGSDIQMLLPQIHLLHSLSLSTLLSSLPLPRSLSKRRKRELVCEGKRERHSKISEGKNNARYSWGNHLTSNLFCSLSLSLSYGHVCTNGIYGLYRRSRQTENDMKVRLSSHKQYFAQDIVIKGYFHMHADSNFEPQIHASTLRILTNMQVISDITGNVEFLILPVTHAY